MSDNPVGENSIDSLAERAKEMLERVRGAAEPSADETITSTTEVEQSPVEAVVDPVDEVVDPEPEEEAEPEPEPEPDLEEEPEPEPEEESEPEEEPEPELDSAPASSDDESADTDEHEAGTSDSSTSRLGLLANKAKESLDHVAGTPTAVSASEVEVDDAAPDTADADDTSDAMADDLVEADSSEADLGEIDLGDLDPEDLDLEELDLEDIGFDAPIEDADASEADAESRSGFVDSLQPSDGAIDISDLDTQEVDIPLPEIDDSSTVTGASAASAGSAVVAGSAGVTSRRDEDAFGLDADIGDKRKPAFAGIQGSSEPHIDADLNDLFIETTEPEPRARAFKWLLPLIILALAVLAFVWWLSGQGNSDDPTDPDTDQTQIDDTADDPENDTDSTTSPTTATTESTTSSTESTTTESTEPPIPANAWELLGEDSNTSSFASLGVPLDLRTALEQQVDDDGNPLEFTLFAPSNDALQKLSDTELATLAGDPDTAKAIIDYHFVDQRITPELLVESVGDELRTRSGAPILVTQDGDDIVLNGEARISLAGLEAANGNVIVIDTLLRPPSVNALLDLGNIEFEPIKSVLTTAGEAELQKAVTYFKENPDTTALIEGHTDTDGNADANLRLSERRAQAVRQFLVDQGIDGSRLTARGVGETNPIIVDGVEDKAASRRIEFTLQ